jgi:hypothetical protein
MMNIARFLISFVALFCYGGLLADAVIPFTAKMHLWNPKWPPHAKFHNGQTMLMGILGGSLSLFILFYFRPLTRTYLLLSAAVASLYWLALLLSPLFPGTDWVDPEFAAEVKHPLGLNPQQLVAYVLCATLALAIILAVKA